jgi:ATP-dependent Clp protease protease subunit
MWNFDIDWLEEFISILQVMKDLNRIKRFSAKEALDYGIIDKIVRPKRIKPDARRQESIGVGLG